MICMEQAEKKSILIAFGQRVRDLRKARGLSQKELAELSGLHRNYVGGIERGERNPSLVNIVQLARGLELEPQDLFVRTA